MVQKKIKLNYNFKFFFKYYNFIKNFFFIKLINLFIFKGKKFKIEKYFSKFFNILKYKFKIVDPLFDLLKLLYINLVPCIRPIRIGFKMRYVKGFFIDPYSRVNRTFNLFIRDIRKKLNRKSIITNLLIEFFKLKYNKTCRLKIFNKNIIQEIKQFDLTKNVK